jgi:hypothetical protein
MCRPQRTVFIHINCNTFPDGNPNRQCLTSIDLRIWQAGATDVMGRKIAMQPQGIVSLKAQFDYGDRHRRQTAHFGAGMALPQRPPTGRSDLRHSHSLLVKMDQHGRTLSRMSLKTGIAKNKVKRKREM